MKRRATSNFEKLKLEGVHNHSLLRLCLDEHKFKTCLEFHYLMGCLLNSKKMAWRKRKKKGKKIIEIEIRIKIKNLD